MNLYLVLGVSLEICGTKLLPHVLWGQKVLAVINKMESNLILLDTVLYGIDAKYYGATIMTDTDCQSSVSQLYFIGDCSGTTTYSLFQAASIWQIKY